MAGETGMARYSLRKSSNPGGVVRPVAPTEVDEMWYCATCERSATSDLDGTVGSLSSPRTMLSWSKRFDFQ
jgi:hypothetical protein